MKGRGENIVCKPRSDVGQLTNIQTRDVSSISGVLVCVRR